METLFLIFVIFLERKMLESAEGARVRLVNSGSPCAGRVEVYYGGQWCTVSGDGFGASGWDMLNAAVVCKELGCGAALSASGDAHFGEGSGPVVTRYDRCRWMESALRRCPSWGWRHYNWISHSHDAGVICSGK
ncbi:scavenger receptor cysteine-rich type 1 protein M130-like isoform X1 [Callorhinchus milii]|uniref:scavenger receptor cysteine-rich type 1 protein M130-like isoform X1 n=1 Tax=Callorhinchus milii TaxID=7868 RepID=UPI001C3FAC39|nr:scavenger receptor cysteine-rich type 1 protein M130-like isoform X1 [Callorhinchus milii]